MREDIRDFWPALIRSPLKARLTWSQTATLRPFVAVLRYLAEDEQASVTAWKAFKRHMSGHLNMAATLGGGLDKAPGERIMEGVVDWARAELTVSDHSCIGVQQRS